MLQAQKSNVPENIKKKGELEVEEKTVVKKNESPITQLLLSCALCNYRSYDESVLNEHISVHKFENKFCCLHCNFSTQQQVELLLHSQVHSYVHTKELNLKYNCVNCSYRCSKDSEFLVHMDLHVPQFKCTECAYVTEIELALLKHFTEIHMLTNNFNCNLCMFVTSDVGDFVSHLRLHKGDQPFKCSLCQFRTHNKNNLLEHLETHGFYLLKCEACYIKCHCDNRNKNFLKKRRPFSCSICFYKFTRCANLNRHLKLHQNNGRIGNVYCAICGYGATSKLVLVNHLKMHEIEN